MTVDELIARLKAYPPAMPVCVQGYEGGYSDIGVIQTVPMVKDWNSKYYYGPHEPVANTDMQADMMALVLYRAPNPNTGRKR